MHLRSFEPGRKAAAVVTYDRQILRATEATVAPIPLPAGAWLLGAGLLGLAGLKRRSRAAALAA